MGTKQPSTHWWFLYILVTTRGLYVGITYRLPIQRWREHITGNGAEATKSNPVLGVLDVRLLGHLTEVQARKIENKVTREYRDIFGKEHVVGGDYVYERNKLA